MTPSEPKKINKNNFYWIHNVQEIEATSRKLLYAIVRLHFGIKIGIKFKPFGLVDNPLTSGHGITSQFLLVKK